MTAGRLRAGAFASAALVAAAGGVYAALAARALGAPVTWGAVADGVVPALAPALALVVVTRYARGHRLASWAALVGGMLTLALGVALYAAALRPDARPGAPVLALSFVPLRQLVAVAFAFWAASLAKRTRDEG